MTIFEYQKNFWNKKKDADRLFFQRCPVPCKHISILEKYIFSVFKYFFRASSEKNCQVFQFPKICSVSVMSKTPCTFLLNCHKNMQGNFSRKWTSSLYSENLECLHDNPPHILFESFTFLSWLHLSSSFLIPLMEEPKFCVLCQQINHFYSSI